MLIILGIFTLLWPLSILPKLLENKKRTGFFFEPDKRILVPKYLNMGNNLNQRSKVGFLLNVVLGLILIVMGILS